MDLVSSIEASVWWQNQQTYFDLVKSEGHQRLEITPEGAPGALSLFKLEDGQVVCPYKTSLAYIPLAPAEAWSFALIECSKVSNLASIRITLPPAPFMQVGAVTYIENYLKHIGANTLYSDVNAHIDIVSDEIPLVKDERRYLKLARQAGIICEQVHPGALGQIWPVVESNRQSKNFSLPITKEDLAEQIYAFPDRYTLLAAYDTTHTPVAAIILVELAPGHLYTFITAHIDTYDKVSPLIALHEYAYQLARQAGAHTLDLGTCSLHGQVNQGVYNFKKKLGAVFAPKPTYLLSL